MAIGDELEKLRELHDSGNLSDEEYAKAKDAAIRGAGAEPAGGADQRMIGSMFGYEGRTLGDAANRYVSFQIVMAGIGLILFLVVACAILSNGNHLVFGGP